MISLLIEIYLRFFVCGMHCGVHETGRIAWHFKLYLYFDLSPNLGQQRIRISSVYCLYINNEMERSRQPKRDESPSILSIYLECRFPEEIPIRF